MEFEKFKTMKENPQITPPHFERHEVKPDKAPRFVYPPTVGATMLHFMDDRLKLLMSPPRSIRQLTDAEAQPANQPTQPMNQTHLHRTVLDYLYANTLTGAELAKKAKIEPNKMVAFLMDGQYDFLLSDFVRLCSIMGKVPDMMFQHVKEEEE